MTGAIKKMTDTLLILILSVGMGIFHNANKPTPYLLNMEDGTQEEIIIQKNSEYACPMDCGVDHIHQAILCNDDKQIHNNQFVYHISVIGKNDIGVYCSLKKFISMNKITPKTIKEDGPDIVTASSEN